jgi:TetR/AcrR family transcriptional regulator, transcriptional repressor for nem operon
MPYPAGHRERVRAKIVESARRLFNRSGFESVSVDSIMANAGLTRGGFYSYFDSKSDLYAEALGCFFTDPNWKNRWKGVKVDPSLGRVGPQIVQAYLSRQHFESVENSCPMVALPNDVARSGDRVKAAFENVFEAMVGMLALDVSGSAARREEAAMAIAALCIGGMVVARSVNDRRLGDRLREAAASVALQLGGWAPDGRAKRTAPRRAKSAGRGK